MLPETLDIRLGMDVYGCDGVKIGTVAHIYRVLPETELGGAGAEARATIASAITYLRVESGRMPGLGTKEVYVPITTVDTAAEGCVTLKCTKNKCLDHYATKPMAFDETAKAASDVSSRAR